MCQEQCAVGPGWETPGLDGKQLLKADRVGDGRGSRRLQVADDAGEGDSGSAEPTSYDLVIRGGRVIDRGGGSSGELDVGVVGDRIASVGADLAIGRASEIVDASGCIVVPGLVDLHTHIFPGGTFWGVDPEPVAWRTGVTTFVDAGSAGAFSADAFRRHCADRASARVYAFLNISTIGLVAETGESRREELCDAKLAAATIAAHRDFFVGVKCRLDRRAVGDMGLLPLHRAIEAADETGLPVMVHIGAGPPEIDLPTCLSKFLALGMSLEDVVAAATVNPARALSRSELGRIDVGGCADISVFEVEKGDVAFFDTELVERRADRLLVNRATIVAGKRLPPVPPARPARWIETTSRQDALLSEQMRSAEMRRPWVSRLGAAGDYVSYK